MFIWFPDYRQLIKEFCCIIIKLICCMEGEQVYENKVYCNLIRGVWSVLCCHTYVFYWLGDHVVNKFHFCKEFVDLVWRKVLWRFSLLHFIHYSNMDNLIVNWMLFVCYMNKQAWAEFSQVYLANYELCWILPLY